MYGLQAQEEAQRYKATEDKYRAVQEQKKREADQVREWLHYQQNLCTINQILKGFTTCSGYSEIQFVFII